MQALIIAYKILGAIVEQSFYNWMNTLLGLVTALLECLNVLFHLYASSQKDV